jgi:hypothetical protein
MKASHVAVIDDRPCRRLAGISLCGALVLIIGCADTDLPTYYGRAQVPLIGASVNGTDVLAGMFSAAGHTVAVRRTLITSDMESVDAVVWFPNDYAVPSPEVLQWFEDWLAKRPGRTLIYVGRTFDAAPSYWRAMAPLVSKGQQGEYRKREQQAKIEAAFWARPASEDLTCAWFEIRSQDSRAARELTGPWCDGIDLPKTDISLWWRLVPARTEQVLLASDGETIVGRQQPTADGGQLITVANGSFLLNLPLVNHEHRKLAGKLIDTVGSSARVVFLESDKGGPPIDPPATDGSLWRMFAAWPLGVILLHFGVLGVIFCFARWPIFGRPRPQPPEVLVDFGKHVAAVGELLRRSKDRDYALAQLPPSEDSPSPTLPGSSPDRT